MPVQPFRAVPDGKALYSILPGALLNDWSATAAPTTPGVGPLLTFRSGRFLEAQRMPTLPVGAVAAETVRWALRENA